MIIEIYNMPQNINNSLIKRGNVKTYYLSSLKV